MDHSYKEYNGGVRRLRTILIFLLLGAVLNVLVALASFVLLDEKSDGWSEMRVGAARLENEYLWSVWRLKRRGFLLLECNVWQGETVWNDQWEKPGATIEPWSMRPAEWATMPAKRYEWYEMASGWPCLAMWTRLHIRDPLHDFALSGLPGLPGNTRVFPRDILERGWLIDRSFLPRQVILPYGIIWSGLIINTLFYALMIPVIFIGLRRARQSIRRHRGLCPHCAYDLRGAEHETCPECGRPTSRARQ